MGYGYQCDLCGRWFKDEEFEIAGGWHSVRRDRVPDLPRAILLGKRPEDGDWVDWCSDCVENNPIVQDTWLDYVGARYRPLMIGRGGRMALVVLLVGFDIWLFHQVYWWWIQAW